MSEEYSRETAAFDVTIPVSNTANSVNDILLDQLKPRLPGSGTISTLTASDVATAKEKAFYGAAGQKPLNEYFTTVADAAAPDTAIWTGYQNDTGGTFIVELDDAAGYLSVKSGATAANDMSVNTRGKLVWSLKSGVTTLCLRCYLKVVDLTGRFGIGFIDGTIGVASSAALNTAANYIASIYCDNDVVNARSSDGSTAQSTALTDYFADNTYVTLIIKVTATNVTFYIDGTLRATHSTNVPAYSEMAAMAVCNANAINTELRAQYIEVWTE